MRQKQKYQIVGIICASFISGLFVYSIHSFIFKYGTGTVVYISIEGGFYGIITDDYEKYDPTNLDEDFEIDGLRVQFAVRLRRWTGSIHMWGMIVEILYLKPI